jgi:hypothetical protein
MRGCAVGGPPSGRQLPSRGSSLASQLLRDARGRAREDMASSGRGEVRRGRTGTSPAGRGILPTETRGFPGQMTSFVPGIMLRNKLSRRGDAADNNFVPRAFARRAQDMD